MGIPYSQKVIEHFKNPRNVGRMEDYDAKATEGSPACGDMVTLYLKVDDQSKTIEDVKFESYQTPQYFEDQISGLGTSPTGTVSDLYYEMSYGQFLPDFEVIGPFTLPGNMYAYDYQLPGGKSVTGRVSAARSAAMRRFSSRLRSSLM